MYCVYDTLLKKRITTKPIPLWMIAAKICADFNEFVNCRRYEPKLLNSDNSVRI